MKKNLAIICNIEDQTPVGVVCCCPNYGDIAYLTENQVLSEVIEIILDNKAFMLNDNTALESKMIIEEEIKEADSYYLMSLNYSLPLPWRILGITAVDGDVEEIVEEAFAKISATKQ